MVDFFFFFYLFAITLPSATNIRKNGTGIWISDGKKQGG